MDTQQTLARKIKNRRAVVGVIGLGYAGLPLVLRFNEERFSVIGFDIDPKKIRMLNAGKSYIKHIPARKIRALGQSGNFRATTDYSLLREADAILVCVPTPLTANKEPDLSFVRNTADQVAAALRRGQLISLESTTYPGTTREILLPRFEKKGLRVGKDYFLVYSPEREDPGNARFKTKNIPKVVGGLTPACAELGTLLYSQVVNRVVTVSSPEAAEFTKILENTFRSVNIALVNELKILADKMNVDIWEVIDAARSKPFGFMPFYPGPGLGGHCIPIDPFYLAWKARKLNSRTQFIELAGEVNTDMPAFVIGKMAEALRGRGKALKGAKILILGIAYKKDVDDIRESPALEIMKRLKEKGGRIYYNDPFIPRIPRLRKYTFDMESSPLSEGLLKKMDAVMIVADHSAYDYPWIVDKARLVIDTRNATRDVRKDRDKIVKA
jgi:UDP-N-acetyl-D-glucosamine dehydrogenase